MGRGRKPLPADEVVKFTKLVITLGQEADRDIIEFMDTLQRREKSEWVREAIRAKMQGRVSEVPIEAETAPEPADEVAREREERKKKEKYVSDILNQVDFDF